MMKLTGKKKIVFAALALFMAIALASGSTFAWFSMNRDASATGMQVTVKSDNTYLLINTGDNDTAAEIQTAALTTVPLTVSDLESKIYPSAPALTNAEVAYLTVAEGHKTVAGDAISTAGVQVTNAATTAAVTNWYTATAEAPSSATMKAGSAVQLTSFSGYVIERTAYLTVAQGANHAKNLTVKATMKQKTGGTDLAACKVIVTTSNGGFAVLDSTHLTAALSDTDVDILNDSTVIKANIYIYYDGNDSGVYTNNAANLKGANIELGFNVEAIPAA